MPSGVVVHLFSFSKSLFPGARVGAVSVRGRLREALLALKHASDLSDALPLQAALAEFVASGEYDRHLARLRRVLRGRRDALLEALAAHMPEGSRWTHPEGGYQVWLELPGALDTRDLLADAVAPGVLFAPGSQFYSDGRPSNGLRLSFAMAGRGRAAQRRRAARARGGRAPHERRARVGARARLSDFCDREEIAMTQSNGNGEAAQRRAVVRDQGRARRDAQGRRDHGRHARPSRRRSPRRRAPPR